MRIWVALAPVLTIALAFPGCTGSSSTPGASAAPATPSPTTPPATSVPTFTVSIVSSTAGSGSFVPNPVPANTGDTVAWHNNDVTTHHIVLDNGSADFGTLAPGATTSSITVSSSVALSFHCLIHPSMVGSINGTVVSAPPPASPAPYAARH